MPFSSYQHCVVPALVLAGLGLVSSSSHAAAQYYGDVNGDDRVDVVDSLCISQYYVGMVPQCEVFNADVADVDNNDSIDIVDALLVARYYVGLIDHFPAIDLSKRVYFPPIGNQIPEGTCTAWSAGYYYNTFLQARNRDVDVTAGALQDLCSVHYLFSQYNIPADLPQACMPDLGENYTGAECTRTAMQTLADVGCASEAVYPSFDSNGSPFPLVIEPDSWDDVAASALANRVGPLQSIVFPAPNEDGEAALTKMKQVLARTQLLVTRAHFGGNYWTYPGGDFVDNGVMYDIAPHTWYFRHSLAIVGYDDARRYTDASGTEKQGAFLLANSEGDGWGVSNTTGSGGGFLWVAYEMFTDHKIGFYVHDEQDLSPYECYGDPCYDNEAVPTVYYHDDLP